MLCNIYFIVINISKRSMLIIMYCIVFFVVSFTLFHVYQVLLSLEVKEEVPYSLHSDINFSIMIIECHFFVWEFLVISTFPILLWVTDNILSKKRLYLVLNYVLYMTQLWMLIVQLDFFALDEFEDIYSVQLMVWSSYIRAPYECIKQLHVEICFHIRKCKYVSN